MDEPPPKRQRREDIPCFYYHLLGTVLPLFGIEPARDLKMFQDAFVPDHADPDTIGQTEDNPYHIPPSLAKLLLAAANPAMKLAAVADRLVSVTNACRDPELIRVLYDLGASTNTKAAVSWTVRYDAIVDSICRDDKPLPALLPVREPIVEIAILVQQGAVDLAPYFPGTWRVHCTRKPEYEYAADEIMKEATTTTRSARKQFLNRVLTLGRLAYIPSLFRALRTQACTKYLKTYWAWRNSVVLARNEYEDVCITSHVAFRYAMIYERTRALFSPVLYNKSSAYIFAHNYNYETNKRLYQWHNEVVDPVTGDFIDLATDKEIWTPELTEFLAAHSCTTIPNSICQFALRNLPTARTSIFSAEVFMVHPIAVNLLNRAPQNDSATACWLYQSMFTGLRSTDLYWDNLDALPQHSYSTNNLYSEISLPTFRTGILQDPEKNTMCFHPKIRQLFTLAPQERHYEARLALCIFDPAPFPLGERFDDSLKSGKRYAKLSRNRDVWRMLNHFRCGSLFNKKIQRIMRICLKS